MLAQLSLTHGDELEDQCELEDAAREISAVNPDAQIFRSYQISMSQFSEAIQ